MHGHAERRARARALAGQLLPKRTYVRAFTYVYTDTLTNANTCLPVPARCTLGLTSVEFVRIGGLLETG